METEEIEFTSMDQLSPSNRKCGDCTKCCEGTLEAIIFDKPLRTGLKCHFLEKACTIHSERPYACREYFCVWMRDNKRILPEWMKPNLSNVIITQRYWGAENNKVYWDLVECNGTKIDSTVLNWVLMHCSQNNISIKYRIAGGVYYHSVDPEFAQHVELHR